MTRAIHETNDHGGLLRVLIVDDNAEWANQVRRLIERKLPASGREVVWESTLAGALDSQKTFKPDITLLDLHLPDAGPDESIAAINEFIPPVFVMSAVGMEDELEFDRIKLRCIKAGAVRVYSKDSLVIFFLVGELVQEHLVNRYGPSRAVT